MEGGFIINLDGTLLLELPGPRVAGHDECPDRLAAAEIGEIGMKGGILAVIEITPEHFLIGDHRLLGDRRASIKIVIPIEACSRSAQTPDDWHIYLGPRTASVEVNVLGIVKGTGYLMFHGNGLHAFKPATPSCRRSPASRSASASPPRSRGATSTTASTSRSAAAWTR